MDISAGIRTPVVSVIIPCYNQAHFLEQAIKSVLQQNWRFIEIIVIDDGSSTDAAAKVAARFEGVKYFYQENQGLSNARNTGIKYSTGQFLIMLDADDWLYPEAISANIRFLLHSPEIAFVSGAFNFVDAEGKIIEEICNPINADHYLRLLEVNYIGSPAAVMYQRWIFDKFKFGSIIDACSDYDIYLRIARVHPIRHHTHKIAAYRQHTANMSSNIPVMMATSLTVLQKQKDYLRSEAELQAFKRGILTIRRYHGKKVLGKFLKTFARSKRHLKTEEYRILIENLWLLFKDQLYIIRLALRNKLAKF